MKKLFLSLLLIWLLAGCGGGPGGGPTADTAESSTDANGEVQLAEELSVYNWSDYIDEELNTRYAETYRVHVT